MRSFLQVYSDLANDPQYMSDLAHDMLSAEDGNENPSEEQLDDAKQRAIKTGYLIDLAREHHKMQHED